MQATFGELLRLARNLSTRAKAFTTATGRCHICRTCPPDPHGADPYSCRSCSMRTQQALERKLHVRHFT